MSYQTPILVKAVFLASMLLLAVETGLCSRQSPELLVLGADTVQILQFPLEEFLSANKDNYLNHLRNQGTRLIISSNWRGYTGIWSIENEMLYFVGFRFLLGLDPLAADQAMDHLFGERVLEGRVFADWFSGVLVVPRGEVLRYLGFTSEIYLEEEVLTFRNGQLVDRQLVSNYSTLTNRISRYSKCDVEIALIDRVNTLNWERLQGLNCNDYYVIIIDDNGRIKSVEIEVDNYPSLISEYNNSRSMRRCRRAIQRSMRGLQFDIIKMQGNPIEEVVYLEILYDEETNQVESLNPSCIDWELISHD